ncbi:unnamed protein product [Debaryomyces tyrocola]|nr:unnamed protein product [Debaryomyces tyrocola]
MKFVSIATIITIAFAVVAEAGKHDGDDHKDDHNDHDDDHKSHPKEWPAKWCDRQCKEVISLGKECEKQKNPTKCLCSKQFQKELDQCRDYGCENNYKKKNWGKFIEPFLKDCKKKNHGYI